MEDSDSSLEVFQTSNAPRKEMGGPKRGQRKKRRKRTVITAYETEKLETSFTKQPRPTRLGKMELAVELGKPESFVSTWFQNRRARARKCSTDSALVESTANSSNEENEQTLSDKRCQDHEEGRLESSTSKDTQDTGNRPLTQHDVFRRMISMAAAKEGGILALEDPSFTSAVTDAAVGIKLLDGKLFYGDEFGFDVNELDLR